MRKLLLQVITAGILHFCAPASYAQEPVWTESEMIIAGFKTPSEVEALPVSLDIPHPWEDAMAALDRQAKGLPGELGACLGIVAETSDADRKLFKAKKSALRKNRIMADDVWEVEFNKLAFLADAKINRNEGTRITWSSGSVQAGTEGSVDIEGDETKCGGQGVSNVHTHPAGAPLPSDADIEYNNAPVGFVQLNGEVCATVRTRQATKTKLQQTKGIISSVILQWRMRTEESDVVPPAAVVAAGLKELGVGLYCGEIGKSLALIQPGKSGFNPNDPRFYLLAKGVVIALKYQLNGAAINFGFTPELDQAFILYIQNSGLFDSDQIGEILKAITPAETYRRIVTSANNKTSIGAYSRVDIPDTRSVVGETASYSTVCTSAHCMVSEDFGTALLNRKIVHSLAYYQEDNKHHYVVDRNEGKDTILEVESEPRTITGSCQYSGFKCVLSGIGKVRSKTLELKGTFKNGALSGLGALTYLDTGEEWKVRGTSKGIDKIERLN